MRNIIAFIQQIFEKRYLLYQLTKRDLTSKYVESYLGLTWAILEPIATTVILSVIFTLGFKAGPVQDVPFFLYMFSGMIAFNFFSISLGEGTNVIRQYSFLVKKVDFKLSILPIMKNLSSSVLHGIMISLLIIVLVVYGYYPTLYWFQFLYYFFAMNMLVLGLSWLTSSLSVFIPDLSRITSISLQFLFYLSPIFWSTANVSEKWLFFLKLNPMYYIIQGYRDSFIYRVGFWNHFNETIYFWGVTALFLILGTSVFRKLRPQFADVL